MQLAETTIQAAFEKHYSVYHGQLVWDIPYHVKCWTQAAAAFGQGSFKDFNELYIELRNRWQALRPSASKSWPADVTFRNLGALNPFWRTRRLQDLEDADMVGCRHIVEAMAEIKPKKGGPSIVAISKFLHFWNPRCFVIVDDAVMWSRVMAPRWIWSGVKNTRNRIQAVTGLKTSRRGACDVLSYLAILRWSADVIRANPAIIDCFARHVRTYAAPTVPIESYQAAAMEWLLLGLVEVPPAGVVHSSGAH